MDFEVKEAINDGESEQGGWPSIVLYKTIQFFFRQEPVALPQHRENKCKWKWKMRIAYQSRDRFSSSHLEIVHNAGTNRILNPDKEHISRWACYSLIKTKELKASAGAAKKSQIKTIQNLLVPVLPRPLRSIILGYFEPELFFSFFFFADQKKCYLNETQPVDVSYTLTGSPSLPIWWYERSHPFRYNMSSSCDFGVPVGMILDDDRKECQK